ncbi:MAG: DUF3078 domain-containing protein [Bacteroidales bacterium]|nr:DUF3078 domain-containing protein [Candidatus Scybalocola fimicaballi]
MNRQRKIAVIVKVVCTLCMLLLSSRLFADEFKPQGTDSTQYNYNPLVVIDFLDQQMSESKPASYDGFKYNLLRQYVSEKASLGDEIAYDSLSKRSMRYIYANAHGGKSNNYSGLDDLESDLDGEKELDKLRIENAELKREVERLQHQVKNKGDRMSTADLKKANQWVEKFVAKTRRDVDSLTKIQLKWDTLYALPYSVDTIKSIVLTPYFTEDTVKSVYLPGLTMFEKKSRRNNLRKEIDDRLMYSAIQLDPTIVSYYGLNEYKPEMVDFSDMDVRYVQVENSYNHELKLDMKKRSHGNDAWHLKGKIGVDFCGFLVFNWASGGKNTMTLSSVLSYQALYEKNRFKWDNNFSYNLGLLFTAQDVDTVHPFRVNEDELLMNSRCLYKMENHNSLYYGLMDVKVKTCLLPGYDSYNAQTKATTLMAPGDVFWGPGMYFERKGKAELFASPISGRWTWVRGDLDPKEFGYKEDERTMQAAPGFRIDSNLKWQFSKDLKVTTGFESFLPYKSPFKEMMFLQWDLTGKFKINKYVSMGFNLKLRYDGHARGKYRDKAQCQTKQTIGFAYMF